MIQMMEVRIGIRKASFYGTINPEKMINQIFYQKNSTKRPLIFGIFPETTLQLRNRKPVSGRSLFNPAVTLSKIRASNLQSAKKFLNPQSEPRSTFTPLENPQTSQISPVLSPQPPSNSWQADLKMAPKRSHEKDGKGKESQPPYGEWTYNKCSNNELMNLVSEGLLQEKSLVN
jgi:hypothetical protein